MSRRNYKAAAYYPLQGILAERYRPCRAKTLTGIYLAHILKADLSKHFQLVTVMLRTSRTALISSASPVAAGLCALGAL